MPEMDGFELCRLIKNTPDLKNIPVIFLTSFSDEESIRKGFESGGQDYVVKPFNASELLSRVKTHLMLKCQAESLKKPIRNWTVSVIQSPMTLNPRCFP